MKRCLQYTMAVALGALLFVGPARADETYPNGPIRIICPIGAGNGPDLALRVVAEQLGKRWHQQVLVINQPGAGSLIAARNAAVERPDGSTFFMAVASTFVALPVMHSNLPLDVNDFVPVGFIGEVPMVLAVSPSLPVHSVDEFIRFAREHPGRVAVATTLPGDITDLSLEIIPANFRDRFCRRALSEDGAGHERRCFGKGRGCLGGNWRSLGTRSAPPGRCGVKHKTAHPAGFADDLRDRAEFHGDRMVGIGRPARNAVGDREQGKSGSARCFGKAGGSVEVSAARQPYAHHESSRAQRVHTQRATALAADYRQARAVEPAIEAVRLRPCSWTFNTTTPRPN